MLLPWLGVTRALLVGGEIPDRSFAAPEHLERGRLAHQLTAEWDHGRDPVVPVDLIGAMEGYQRFLAELRPRWAAIEEPVQSEPLRVRGKLDRRAAELLDAPAIVDLKLGRPEPWHGVQLAGYWWLAGAPAGCRRWGLYLRDGRYWLREYADGDDLRRFVECVRKARFAAREHEGEPIEAVYQLDDAA